MTLSDNLRSFIVHEFLLGDCDDPEIYAAQPLYEWEKTKKGSWVLARATGPVTYHISVDINYIGYKCIVEAKFAERDAVEYILNFADQASPYK